VRFATRGAPASQPAYLILWLMGLGRSAFGCGRSYHQACLQQIGSAAQSAAMRLSCPQCAKASGAESSTGTLAPRARHPNIVARGVSGGSALDVHKLRPMQDAVEEDSDDDDALAARERALALGRLLM